MLASGDFSSSSHRAWNFFCSTSKAAASASAFKELAPRMARHPASVMPRVNAGHKPGRIYLYWQLHHFSQRLLRGNEMYKRGDIVEILLEFQDSGDSAFTWIVLNDEEKGRVDITPIDITLSIKPIYTMNTTQIKRVTL
jgi:hypothetical protein